MTGQLYQIEITLERRDGWQDYAKTIVNVDAEQAIVYGATVYLGERYKPHLGGWDNATKRDLKKFQRTIDSGVLDVDIVEDVRNLITKKENQL
jgi:hypothetical protein